MPAWPSAIGRPAPQRTVSPTLPATKFSTLTAAQTSVAAACCAPTPPATARLGRAAANSRASRSIRSAGPPPPPPPRGGGWARRDPRGEPLDSLGRHAGFGGRHGRCVGAERGGE